MSSGMQHSGHKTMGTDFIFDQETLKHLMSIEEGQF